MGKRDLYIGKGIWCLNDIKTPTYGDLRDLSQHNLSTESQTLYGHYMAGIVLMFLLTLILKNQIYQYFRRHSPITKQPVFLIDRILAVCRYIGYRRVSQRRCGLLRLPASLAINIIFLLTSIICLSFVFAPEIHFYWRRCAGFGPPPISTRAGTTAVALFPFIAIVSGKTNVVSWLTKVGYEKLTIFHSFASVLFLILSVCHAVPFVIQMLVEGGSENVKSSFKQSRILRNGIPPLIFIVMLTFLFNFKIRKRFYEVSFHFHWLAAIGMVVTLYLHVAQHLNARIYLDVAIFVTVSQLVYRLLVKSPYFSFKTTSFTLRNAVASVLSQDPDCECFQIVIENDGKLCWQNGQHLFIKLLTKKNFLDKHPFSIASHNLDSSHIKLIIKPMQGFTRHTFNQAKRQVNNKKTLQLLIDGTYGGLPRSIDSFTNIYLFATGTGIAAIVSHLIESVRLLNQKDSSVAVVRLDWVVKHQDNINWIADELQSLINSNVFHLEQGRIEFYVYSKNMDRQFEFTLDIPGNENHTAVPSNDQDEFPTGGYELQSMVTNNQSPITSPQLNCFSPHPDDNLISAHKNFNINFKVQSARYLNLIESRPNITGVVRGLAPVLGQKNYFICCGSYDFKNEVSTELASLQSMIFMKKNNNVKEIYLHCENFGW